MPEQSCRYFVRITDYVVDKEICTQPDRIQKGRLWAMAECDGCKYNPLTAKKNAKNE